MQHLVRNCFKKEGYVFAKKAEDISREFGVERIARLASNENPRPPSPLAVNGGCAAISRANRYPDEHSGSLVAALRRYHGDYHFVTGVGMDGIIETLIRALVDPGDLVAVSTPSFSYYKLAATAQGGNVVSIPREEDFSLNSQSFIERAGDAKISFLCSPNNPTGNATPVAVIEECLQGIDGLLFLDNAYVEFSDIDYRPLMKKYENLVIGRTMSKIFSLAGLRVGYAFVPEWLKLVFCRAATPFALSSVSAAAAEGALRDSRHVSETIEYIKLWRERFARECAYPAYPSDANFILVDCSPLTGNEMAEKMASRGVLVRSCDSFSGLASHYIRVSIGDEWENEQFLGVINSL